MTVRGDWIPGFLLSSSQAGGQLSLSLLICEMGVTVASPPHPPLESYPDDSVM